MAAAIAARALVVARTQPYLDAVAADDAYRLASAELDAATVELDSRIEQKEAAFQLLPPEPVDSVANAAWQTANASLIAAYNTANTAYNTANSAFEAKLAAKNALAAAAPSNGAYAAVIAESFNCASDSRLKKNIVPLDGALEQIDHIRGVYHNWNDARQSKDRQIGVIAQEMQSVYPELVQLGGNGFLSVNYPKLTAVLLQSIKELKHRHLSSIHELKEMIRVAASKKYSK